MLAMMTDSSDVEPLDSQPIGCSINPSFCRTSLITPDVPLNIHRHMMPMMNPETAHGKEITP